MRIKHPLFPGQQAGPGQYGFSASPGSANKTLSRVAHRHSTTLFVNRLMLETLLGYNYNPFTSENINISEWSCNCGGV